MNASPRIYRCCLLTSTHAPFDDRLFYKEAISLRKAGYEVVIVSLGQKAPEETQGVRFLAYTLKSVPRGFGLGRLIKVVAILRVGLKANADVYHCHTPNLLFAAILVRMAQRLLRGKRAAVIHEIRDFYLSEAYLDDNLGRNQRFRLVLAERWDRFLQRRGDFVIGTAETMVTRSLSYGLPRDRIVVIPNYARLDLFPARPKAFDPKHFVVAYEGGLSRHRGIDKLAEACVALGKRQGTRVTLILAGRWSAPGDEAQFVAYCAKNQRFLDLQSMGWIPHVNVPDLLARADLCCMVFFSKRYERVEGGMAAPIKVYEYMATGKPIVASDLPALRYTIQRARGGTLVDVAGGANAIADAFEFYYTHPECMVEHGANGRRAVEEWFNWSIAEKSLLDIYSRLLTPGAVKNS